MWTVDELGDLDRLCIAFGPDEIAEMRAVVAMAHANNINAADAPDGLFNWPAVDAFVRSVYPEIQHGRGFVVLTRLPVDEFTKDDLALIYWGIGRSIGPSVAQTPRAIASAMSVT